MQLLINLNTITGKDIKVPYFLKITLMRKINKQKHMTIFKGKWMKEEQKKDNKKQKIDGKV